MRNYKNWIWIVLFGSVWGLAEVFVGESLWGKNLPFASVWLSVFALLILASARGILNEPGSSTAVGAFAALFKLANAAPFYCHLLGIFMIGAVFDLFCTAFLKRDRKASFRSALTGIMSAYGSNALFALLITYVIHYRPWVAGGWPKVSHHIFVSGSWTALAAAVLVPIGFVLGAKSWQIVERRPNWAYGSALAGLAVLWVLGRLVG
jgi:hypothetical protein